MLARLIDGKGSARGIAARAVLMGGWCCGRVYTSEAAAVLHVLFILPSPSPGKSGKLSRERDSRG